MNPLETYRTEQLLEWSLLIVAMVRADMRRLDTHGVKISVLAEFRTWEAEQTDTRLLTGLNTLREIGTIIQGRQT